MSPALRARWHQGQADLLVQGTWHLAVWHWQVQLKSLFLNSWSLLMRRNFLKAVWLFSIFYQFKVEIFYSMELQKMDINRWNKMANIDNCSSCTRGYLPYSSLVLCTMEGFYNESVICFVLLQLWDWFLKAFISCTALHPPPRKAPRLSSLPNGP